jgi:hypothetical protein
MYNEETKYLAIHYLSIDEMLRVVQHPISFGIY